MDQPVALSLEQQFGLRSFEEKVKQMPHKQAQEFLVDLYERMMLNDTKYKALLKHQWGIEQSP